MKTNRLKLPVQENNRFLELRIMLKQAFIGFCDVKIIFGSRYSSHFTARSVKNAELYDWKYW